MNYIYLDHAATTPTDPAVTEAMLPYFTSVFGNPSSVHYFGRETRKIVDEGRLALANSIHAKESEVVFTSGGTEADNLAIIGIARANSEKGKHIITTQIEHHAVLHACHYLEKEGFTVTYLPVSKDGVISLDDLEQAITDETILASVMFGNNEVGTIQPIREIGELLKEKNVLFHTDAVQAFGLVSINVKELKIDLLSASSHKINGPKGIGFLYVKEGIKLAPLFFGGEQERKRRAGTENVPGIVGFQKAVELMEVSIEKKNNTYKDFKKVMIDIFDEAAISYKINGDREQVLSHVFNVSFPGVNVESMLVNLDLAGISASSGSACTAGSIDPSHVLVAMHGQGAQEILSSIRFSFGYGNNKEQIGRAAKEIVKVVKRLVK